MSSGELFVWYPEQAASESEEKFKKKKEVQWGRQVAQ